MNQPRPLQAGDPAPTFSLPAADRDGTIALDEYIGRCSVLVGLFRGLWCPFCRRQIAQLGGVSEHLKRESVETLGVLISPVGRCRLYLRHRPAPFRLAADEVGDTHRAFGLPRVQVLPDNGNPNAGEWPYSITESRLGSVRIDLGGVLPEPLPPEEAMERINREDPYPMNEEDGQSSMQHWNQLVGLFLIDRGGTVRWRHIEAAEDPSGIGSFPSADELLAATVGLKH